MSNERVRVRMRAGNLAGNYAKNYARHYVRVFAAAVALAVAMPLHAQGKDIVETATELGTFNTFIKLLADAGLSETLKGPGPFTVFAPSDDAFAKVPAATMAALNKDKAALRNVLLYHVVAGKVMAADVAKLTGKGAKTVQGNEARITAAGDQVMIGTAHITRADIAASNGVIHIVDAVLIPPPRD